MSQLPSASSNALSDAPEWGRVLLCGGTDWPKLGRKEKGANRNEKDNQHPDLLEPHILRSLSNVRAVSVHGSCCGCHFIVLDVDGAAWLFGRNSPSALGVPNVDAISENSPRKLIPADLGAAKGTKFVHAACGRGHSLLVGSDGEVWSAGANNLGQCGHPTCPEISTFKVINGVSYNGSKERVIKAAAGITFSILLTESGRVFSFGSGQNGQLGNGRTGEHITTGNKSAFDIEPHPILVRALEDKKIIQIASGPQHSIALDSRGIVYVWGYNGYCRLGLGNQQDVLIPKIVPQFAGPNEATMGARVNAGPSNSVVVDKQGMYWMAGKWKNSGDGSSGSPYSSFRYMQDIMGCKIDLAACGGVTHWALTQGDDGGVMTVAWGQNAANGELGLGPDEPKSATKPGMHPCLEGIDVFDIAAGQNTTLILAKPSDKLSELPRHPIDVNPPQFCIICNKDNGADDSPLECDKCDSPCHLSCLDPPLDAVPDGEWFCKGCIENTGAPIGTTHFKTNKGKSKSTEWQSESTAMASSGSKRKAPVEPKAGETKRKK